MADLNELQASQTVKIVGSNNSGSEQDYVDTVLREDGKYGLAVQATLPENITVLLGRSQVYDFIHNSNWMSQANYDDVQISVLGSTATLTYMEGTSELGVATVVFTDADNWSVSMKRYICEDDGTPLQDDDSIELNLD